MCQLCQSQRLITDSFWFGGGGGCKTVTIIFSSDCLQSVCSCSFSTVLQMIALNLLFSVFHHQSYFAFFFFAIGFKKPIIQDDI